jgi:hypothetical protein
MELSPQAEVSILTCDKGQEIYALFGHTAIRFIDPATQLDVVFNYGAFDFRTPNFELKFSRGDLQYFITAESFDSFLMQYTSEQRSVWEQQLLLTFEQKTALFNALVAVMNTEKRFYTYKFIDRNCTNMAVAKINEILGGLVIKKCDVGNKSYREIIFPYFTNHFFEQLGTSILFGSKVDERATTLFLPTEFMASLTATKHMDKPLSLPVKTILKAEAPIQKFSWWNNLYSYLAIVTLPIIFFRRKAVRCAFFTFLAIFGLVFIFAMCFSQHAELANNYNILLFNPLLGILSLLELRGKYKSAFIVALSCLGFLALYLIMVISKAHFWIMLPLIAASSLMLGHLIYTKK